mmetsp:Transcript_4123/g.5392  ORF Transcript_4123/g.5392 Transcript_4123/m.5392 type:complete len:349 (-) Transcript_4123:246-1292(-)
MSVQNKAIRTIQILKRNTIDFVYLSRHLIVTRPTSIIETRQLLQEQHVNQQNNFAYMILKVDKEVVYMKYHGLSKYIHIKFMNTTKKWIRLPSFLHPGESSDNGDKNMETSKRSEKIAQVAFMITRQHRQVLIGKLKYTEAQIKSMKPNEAQLILDQDIYAFDDKDKNIDWRNKIAKLRTENDDEAHDINTSSQQQVENKITALTGNDEENHERKKLQSLALGFEERFNHDDSKSNALVVMPTEQIPGSAESSNSNDKQVELNEIKSENDRENKYENESDNDEEFWYEVIELSSLSSISNRNVIALYKSRKEAEECVSIKEEFAMKRQASTSSNAKEEKQYSIHKRMS